MSSNLAFSWIILFFDRPCLRCYWKKICVGSTVGWVRSGLKLWIETRILEVITIDWSGPVVGRGGCLLDKDCGACSFPRSCKNFAYMLLLLGWWLVSLCPFYNWWVVDTKLLICYLGSQIFDLLIGGAGAWQCMLVYLERILPCEFLSKSVINFGLLLLYSYVWQ